MSVHLLDKSDIVELASLLSRMSFQCQNYRTRALNLKYFGAKLIIANRKAFAERYPQHLPLRPLRDMRYKVKYLPQINDLSQTEYVRLAKLIAYCAYQTNADFDDIVKTVQADCMINMTAYEEARWG